MMPKTKIRQTIDAVISGDVVENLPDKLSEIKKYACGFVDYRHTVKKYHRRKQKPVGLAKILTLQEQDIFWCYLEGQKAESVQAFEDFVIWEVLINTGLRVGELVKLRVKDTPEYTKHNSINVYKGKTGSRTVPINTRTKGLIGEWLEYRRFYCAKSWRKNDFDKPLFLSRLKRGYSENGIYKKLQRLAKKAGLTKKFNPHMARHTFATFQLLNKINIETVRKVLGHSDIKITQRYLHICEMMNERLGERMAMTKNFALKREKQKKEKGVIIEFV